MIKNGDIKEARDENEGDEDNMNSDRAVPANERATSINRTRSTSIGTAVHLTPMPDGISRTPRESRDLSEIREVEIEEVVEIENEDTVMDWLGE